jgi:RNA polymerase sigma factor (sigma-70 family)
VQDVWVAAAERAPARIERPRAWLAEVLRNALHSRRRARAPREARERSRARDASESATDDVVARAEAQRTLVEHVLGLEEPWRSTVLLRFFDQLSSEQIAARTGVPASTVRNRLAHALGLLSREARARARHGLDGRDPAARPRRAADGDGNRSRRRRCARGGMLKVGAAAAAVLLGGVVVERVARDRAGAAAEGGDERAGARDGARAGERRGSRRGARASRERCADPGDAGGSSRRRCSSRGPASGVLEVVVLDSGERCPHAGRVVLASDWQPWMWSGAEEPPAEALERGLVDGVARFDGLTSGNYGVRASLAGHIDLTAYVVMRETAGTLVTLASGTSSVEGTAWDEDGRPVPGSKVVLQNKQTRTLSYTRTREDGTYALLRLEAGPHWVSKNGGEVMNFTTVLVPGPNRLDFGSPAPRAHWRGTLRTRSGAEHHGRVVLWVRSTPQGLTTRVIEDGHFDVRLLPGTYRIVAKPDATSSFEAELGEVVVALEDFERDLVLPGARVHGTVRRTDGAPLPRYNMGVGLRHPGDPGLRSVPVDVDGRFVIDAVEPGTYLLNTHPLILDGGVDSLRFELHPGEDELVLDVEVRAP